MAASEAEEPASETADVLTIFGITGDLAKKMTFRALYRLEARDKLDCPIVGVAIDDWDVEKLREHARDAIAATVADPDEDVFDRLAARISYVQGDYADADTFERVGEGDRRSRSGRSSTSRSRPRCSRPSSQGLGDAGLDRERPGRDREAVRPRPRLGPGAQRRAARGAATRTRSCGSTTTSARSR